MPVTTLNSLSVSAKDTWPATFAISAGSNRLAFIVTVATHGSDVAPPTSVSLGGQSMTKLVEADDAVNNRDVACTAWVLDEAGISAMSGSDVVVTGGTYEGNVAFTWSVQGAGQSITNTASQAGAVTSGTPVNLSLPRTADGMSFAAAVIDFASDPDSTSSNPALNVDQARPGVAGAAAGVQSEATTQTLDFSWTPQASRDAASVAFSVEPGTAGPSLTAPASISPGASGQFTVTGLAGAPTSATVSDGTSTLTLTNIALVSGDTYSFDTPALPAVGASLQYTTFGAVTMTVGDGTSTAQDTTSLAAATGQTVTTLAATFDTSELSYLFNFSGTPATGDQFIEGSADLALDANGGYVADTDGTYVITGIDATDGIAQSYELIVGPAAATAGRLTRRNLTRRTLTRRSLTARP